MLMINSTCCTEYTYNSDDNDMYSIVHVVYGVLNIFTSYITCLQDSCSVSILI